MAQAASATFSWEGTDKKGKSVKGSVTAANIAAVKIELRKQGVVPKPGKIKKKKAARGKKITPADIAIFSRQMATMMKAGVPLVQSFDIVGGGHDNPSMAELIFKIKASVEGGNTLASAIREHPLYFDDLFVNLVDAGEQSGALEELLEKIATYKEKSEALKTKKREYLTPEEYSFLQSIDIENPHFISYLILKKTPVPKNINELKKMYSLWNTEN